MRIVVSVNLLWSWPKVRRGVTAAGPAAAHAGPRGLAHRSPVRQSARHRPAAPQCGVASEAAFSKRRAELLASDAGRWALFVQPADRRRRPEFVGCYDTESEACEIGYRSPRGRRFLVKAVLEEDPVISIPWAVPANQL